jgi:hypothetical protein
VCLFDDDVKVISLYETTKFIFVKEC